MRVITFSLVPRHLDAADNGVLQAAADGAAVNSSLRPMTRKTSLALQAQLNPHLALAALAGIGAFLVAARPFSRRARR
jgi:hypothetical protein